jgi:GIY-YIG catalytic domain
MTDVSGVGPQWEERDAWSALADLDESPQLVPARDWPAGLGGLDRAGLYAWWVDEAGAADLSSGLGLTVASGRIYAGQAGATKWPSGRAGDDTLGKRIGQMDLGGRVRMSTFRWTLAAVLFDLLDMQVRASMLITPPSEQVLTEWMRERLSIAVHPHDDRDTLGGLEHAILEHLDPPLNLGHLPPTQVRERLTELRRRISRET